MFVSPAGSAPPSASAASSTLYPSSSAHHDSPYGVRTPGATTPSHAQDQGHFDPHDPAWFTPALGGGGGGGASQRGGGGGGGGAAVGGWGVSTAVESVVMDDDEIEAALGRNASGLGAGGWAAGYAGGGGTGDRPSLKTSLHGDSSAYFDSDYSLAPPISSSSSSTHSPLDGSSHSNYSHSYPSSALHTPGLEHYPVDAEMASSAIPPPTDPSYITSSAPTSQHDFHAVPRATYGATPPIRGDAIPSVLQRVDGRYGDDQPGAAYSLNVVSTMHTSVAYSCSPMSSYQSGPGGPNDSGAYSTLAPPAVFQQPPGAPSRASSSLSSSTSFQSSPFSGQSGSSQTTPALQPSPFAPSAFVPSSQQQQQQPQRTGSSASSSSGPGPTRRARRPSLAHAHTQAVSEQSALQHAQEQAFPASVGANEARHHSFSGSLASSTGAGGGGAAGGREQYGYQDSPRRHTVQGASFSPYPNPHQQSGSPYPSSSSRRRSSNGLSVSTNSPSTTVTSPSISTPTSRRTSAATTISTAPSTPSQQLCRTMQAASLTSPVVPGPGGGAGSPALFSPQPQTPRRGFSLGGSDSPTPTRSGRRNNLNLTISVDAAINYSPSSSAPGSASNLHPSRPRSQSQSHSHGASPAYPPSAPYSPQPYSPLAPPVRRQSASSQPPLASPYSTSGSAAEFARRPPTASPTVSRKRRYSADVVYGAGQSGSQEATQGSSLANFAGYGAGSGGGGGGEVPMTWERKRLSTAFEEDDVPVFDEIDPLQHHHHSHYSHPHHQHYAATAPLQHASFPDPVHQHYHHEQPHSAQPQPLFHPHESAYAQQQQQPTPSYAPEGGPWHAPAQPVEQHLPDGTVGLGLEMCVEELHLAASTSSTIGSAGGGVAPYQVQVQPQLLQTAPPAASIVPPAGAPAGTVLFVPHGTAPPPHSQPFLPTPQQQQHAFLVPSSSLPLVPQPQLDPASSARARLEAEIKAYLRAENRLELGEKTVVVMNPKIAQRSYGTEKRLLAPPPQALILGASWWSTLDSHPSLAFAAAQSGQLPSPATPLHRVTLPPEVYISISTDKAPLRVSSQLQWMTSEGRPALDRDEEDAPPIAGRAVSKSLAVTVPGELNKDVSTTVRTMVAIAEPGAADVQARVWAVIPGKPITVISKPSKKRSITAGAAAGLSHGTLVSLYNRTKTYTGSTRFLCTSHMHAMFPESDWKAMAGSNLRRSFGPANMHDIHFSAKPAYWDAFVVYAVDVDPNTPAREQQPLHPSYPKPPANAMLLDHDRPKPLYYNQTVVLQDLSSGVVSPIMILRRCDAKAVAVGGGSIDGFVPLASDVEGYPVAPGERLGDPVSQYRPIALEVYQDPLTAPSRAEDGFKQSLPVDTYLGISDDNVAMHHPQEGRVMVKPANGESVSQPVTPTTPRSFGAMQQLPKLEGVDEDLAVQPADDLKPKRPRRTSASNASGASLASSAPPRPPVKARGTSTTSLASLGGGATVGMRGRGGPASKVWTTMVGEPCVWTIVNVDVERHTFYVPPSVEGGKFPSLVNPVNPLYCSPRPVLPIGSAIPVVNAVDAPYPSSRSDESGMIGLHGDNFSQDLNVWVGDEPSPLPAIYKSPQLLLFRPPSSVSKPFAAQPGMQFLPHPPPSPRSVVNTRIALVRNDGVVFRTAFSLPDLNASASAAPSNRY